jgi:hypothetical protein
MNKRIAATLFLLCLAPLAFGQKTRFGQPPPKPANPADFTLQVHVSASHLRLNCENFVNGTLNNSGCGYGLYADSVLNGKKLELWGQSIIEKKHNMVLIPGDYRARLTSDIHSKDGAAINQEYDLLLPGGTVWHCVLSSISE